MCFYHYALTMKQEKHVPEVPKNNLINYAPLIMRYWDDSVLSSQSEVEIWRDLQNSTLHLVAIHLIMVFFKTDLCLEKGKWKLSIRSIRKNVQSALCSVKCWAINKLISWKMTPFTTNQETSLENTHQQVNSEKWVELISLTSEY